MLSSLVVSQIKACAERGDRVGEISVAFSISRQSVAKIIKGRSHPKVRAARTVPSLLKLAAALEEATRETERREALDRKRRAKKAAVELEAALKADPDVQATEGRLKEMKRRSKLGIAPDERAALESEWPIAQQAFTDAYERVKARVSGTPTPGSAAPERPPEPLKGPARPLFSLSSLDVPDAVSLGIELKPQE